MTPEQNAEWLARIDLQEHQDSRAVSAAGLMGCSARLTRRGVPFWALRFREDLANLGQAAGGEWVPDFALRSEVALVGLQLLYPDPTEAEPVYRRTYIRFVAELLLPVVEWVARGDGRRQLACKKLLALQGQCEKFTGLFEPEDWYELDYLYGRPRDDVRFDNEAESWLATHAQALGQEIFGELRLILEMSPSRHVPVRAWIERADYVYQLLQGSTQPRSDWGNGRRTTVHAETLARCFLAPLEAECPPPDWLPVI